MSRSYQDFSDQELVSVITKERNPEPFRVIYLRYADKVFRKCLTFTHDNQEAEDLAHDVFLKIYLKLNQYNGVSSFSTWLYSVTYNYCIDHQRKANRQKFHKERYAYEQDQQINEVDDGELFRIRTEELSKLLDQISPDEKALLLMRYMDEIPIKGGITEITNLSEGAIKMRLKRAKEKIIRLSKNIST